MRFDATNPVPKYEQIKEAKKGELRERNKSAQIFLEEALKEATIYVNGDTVQTSAKEISSRINDAFGKLVSSVYHKLSYIDTAMGDSDLYNVFKDTSKQLTLDGTEEKRNALALHDVNDYIAGNTARHTRTSMKSVLDRFLKAPYGFIEADVEWLIAKLFKDGEISLFVNNDAVTLISKPVDEIIRYLTRKEFNEKLMTEKRVKADERQKKAVFEVMKELFNQTTASDDDDVIMKNFLHYAENKKNDLLRIEDKYKDHPLYPGKAVVASGKQLMLSVAELKYSGEFFRTISEKRDDFLDFAEDFEPVAYFFSGEQQSIFDKAVKNMKIYEESKTFIVSDELEQIVAEIKSIVRSSNPYSRIKELPGLLDRYVTVHVNLLTEAAEPVSAAVEEARTRVFAELNGKQCKDKLEMKYLTAFDELREKVNTCNHIGNLRLVREEADALKIRCLNEIASEEAKIEAAKAEKNKPVQPAPTNNGSEPPVVPVSVPKPKVKSSKVISIKSINSENTWHIENAEDVDKYVGALKEKLMKALEDDTVINIEF